MKTNPASEVEVIQSDRDVAAGCVAWQNKFASEWKTGDGGTLQLFHSGLPAKIQKGVYDDHYVVQAFARHRLAHTSAPASDDREGLVERLRAEIERQCGIGAGMFEIDGGFGQSGLWGINADLDPVGLAAALHPLADDGR